MVKKTFHLDPDLWSKFKTLTREHGYSLSGAVNVMIKRFVEELESQNAK